MPRILLAAGAALLLVAGILAVVLRQPPRTARSVTVSLPAHGTTTAAAPPATTTAPPPQVAMSWESAGAFVVHPSAVDPAQLGEEMRAAGFGWLAVDLDSLDPDWIARFRMASGLPVGGWSVLGDDPAADAATAAQLVQQQNLAFYVADAEAPYGYTDGSTSSATRLGRSRAFVTAFRAAEPTLPAALSSYCRPDRHDLDWSAWVKGGFDFLPQAYANDFGANAAPATCVTAASQWFPAAHVHPTIGSYSGLLGIVPPSRWIELLTAAHTTGFSIYPAEAGMPPESWQAYGAAVSRLARPPT